MARTLAPNGHLYTYEFHKQRADIAKEEFESHGLSSVVTLANRDVMKVLKEHEIYLSLRHKYLYFQTCSLLLKHVFEKFPYKDIHCCM